MKKYVHSDRLASCIMIAVILAVFTHTAAAGGPGPEMSEAEQLKSAALDQWKIGNVNKAADLFRQAVAAGDDTIDTHYSFGILIQENFSDMAEAITAFEYVVSQKPGYWEAWYNLGKAHAKNNDCPSAVRAFLQTKNILSDLKMLDERKRKTIDQRLENCGYAGE